MSSSPYAPAAKILNEVWTRRKGLKTVVYSKEGELRCSTSTYAICCHVLKEKSLLEKLLKEVPAVKPKNAGLVYILLYELLMGPNKKIRGGGALKRQIMSQVDILQEKFKKISREEGWIDEASISVNSKTSKSNGTIPRYVRINTLVADREEVLKTIRAKVDEVYIDPHIPDLLVLDHTPQSRALLQDLVVSQKVILQDKSSCFSALCMAYGFENRNKDSNSKGEKVDFLDACAAPGNKTSHLAALVHNIQSNDDGYVSTIYALDKSPDRYKLLKRRISSLVPQGIVECHNQDFFEVSKQKYRENEDSKSIDVDKRFKNVQAIMLDPSCSGSGMISNHTENSVSRNPFYCDERVKTLSNFQYQALYHATTDFPRVDRVVYSTCSLYVQENESVVQRLLASNSDWELCSPKCLERWHRRGLFLNEREKSSKQNSSASLTQEQLKCLIRVHPHEDSTNGFFVACFQRKRQNEKQSSSKIYHEVPHINVPKDMELYSNQFHSKDENNTRAELTPSGETDMAKAFSSDEKHNDNHTIKAKRKIKEISVIKNPSNSDTKPLSKKRAKKLEWKKRQRLKKQARLESQTKKKQVEQAESK